MVGIAFDRGVVVAADTRELPARGTAAVDGVGKLAVAPWGLVSGGGRADVLARVKRSLVCRANPSVAEAHTVVSLALDAAGPSHCTEVLFSYEPRGPARPTRTRATAPEEQTEADQAAMRRRVALYRDEGELAPLVPLRFGLLPPRDVDEVIVREWVRGAQRSLFVASGLPTLTAAVHAVLWCFAALGSLSREVSPDLDLGVHEEGRRFRLARLWW